MAWDMNPNNVKQSEVDEVFIAQAMQKWRLKNKTEVNKYLALHPAQRELLYKKAEEIVKKAQAKKKKKK
jgi:Arc/MetJ family transcription regulator